MIYSLRKYLVFPFLSFVIICLFLSFKFESFYAGPKEKIYLHTDKPYYSRGDTIWFKAYLTINDKPIPSTVSGTCYIDLINEKQLIDTSLKILVKGGLAMGYLALGEMRKEGIYRLRASTKYMQQSGSDLTDKAFIVGDGFGTKIIDADAKASAIPKFNDSNLLALKISSNKPHYKPRELVELDISSFSAIDDQPTTGNFSISVVDENQVPYHDGPETNIVIALHPFIDVRDFISSTIHTYFNEGGITLSGMVKTLTGEPVPNGKVSLLSLNSGIMEQTKTNAEGKFRFEDLRLYGEINFMVQASTQAGSKKVEVIMDKTPVTSYVEKRNLSIVVVENGIDPEKLKENRKKQDKAITTRTGEINRTQRLKEVNIKAKRRVDPRYTTQGGLQIPEGHSDQTYIIEKPESCATLGICLQGKLKGVLFIEREIDHVRYSSYPTSRKSYTDGKNLKNLLLDSNTPTEEGHGPMTVILDGRKLTEHEAGDLFSNNTLDAVDIAKIEVVRSNIALATILGGSSLLIYTKSNKDKFRKIVPNIAYLDVRGMQRSKTFYSPNYASGNKNKLADLRSTIYWNPSVETDKTGRTQVQFYAADEEGPYKVIVEGMTKDGKLGSQVYRFNVSRKP